jgi:hypothetical protein
MLRKDLCEILQKHISWLKGESFTKADLREAYLRGANLREAYLREANLREANLRGANLRGADLQTTKLRSIIFDANTLFPSCNIVLLANWGSVEDDLTSDLMNYDASNYLFPELFHKWANGSEKCPYANYQFSRSCNFDENEDLWKPERPLRTALSLVTELLETYCDKEK